MYEQFDNWLTNTCLDIYDFFTKELAQFQAELYKQLDSRTKND